MKLPLSIPAFATLVVSFAVNAGEVTSHKDLEYARVGDRSLVLDLYLSAKTTRPAPLLIYVHGGAWRSGSKKEVPIAPLAEQGFSIASVDYRLSTEASFPADIHDLKAAIRFLRAKAAEFGYDPKRFAIIGSSAGGHLAALVGVTNGHQDLEGEIGAHRNTSSDVQAIVSFYGASDLQTILGQSTPHGLSVRVPALELLLGGLPEAKRDLAKLASPVTHVDAHDPPLLLIHGDADPQMPIEQSRELHAAYLRVARPVEFITIKGGLHGGKEFYDPERLAAVADFLRKHLP